MVQRTYESCVFPKLTASHQEAMLVPLIAGNIGPPIGQGSCPGRNKQGALAYLQNETVLALEGLLAWAKTQPRVAGFCPWVSRSCIHVLLHVNVVPPIPTPDRPAVEH